ncbi:HAMP domain-containing protein, partial [Maritalea sp.]|uniref:cache domain-containing protein n=1 Tax=Maritalea sp. TaxID=2003361 RepID=UPI003EF83DEF
MSFLSRLQISQKLPALVVGSVVAVGLALGTASVLVGSNSIKHAEYEKLETGADIHAHELETYFKNIASDLELNAHNPFTVSSLKSLNEAWGKIEGDKTKALQTAYIDKNPNPLGSKHLLDAAKTGTEYDKLHGEIHPTFREHLERWGFYDVFLFNDQGDLIYSVFKELDYATNFKTGGGKWADTDLGNAFRGALALDKGEETYLDFKPYAPSADAPASFIATPIFDGKKRIGVLAYQMPIDAINNLMSSTTGLGETGESIIVGGDHFLRNNSKFTAGNDILTTQFKDVAVDAALKGSPTHGEISHYRDMNLLMAAAPFEFHGVHWAVVVVQGKAEALASINNLVLTLAGIGAALAAIIGTFGWFFSKTITDPMSKIGDVMDALAANELDVVVEGVEREDELGDMARAVEVFRENAVQVAEHGVEEAARQKAIAERNAMMSELQQSLGIVVGAAAAGDFSQRVGEDVADDELVKLARSVNSLVETVDRGIRDTGEVLAALANT